jgi:hypothetical protein
MARESIMEEKCNKRNFKGFPLFLQLKIYKQPLQAIYGSGRVVFIVVIIVVVIVVEDLKPKKR